MAKCIECTYSVPVSGSRVNCAVLNKKISDGDKERECPYFYPSILTKLCSRADEVLYQ